MMRKLLLILFVSIGITHASVAQSCRNTLTYHMEQLGNSYYPVFIKQCSHAMTIQYNIVYSDGSVDHSRMEYIPVGSSSAQGRGSSQYGRIRIINVSCEENSSTSRSSSSSSDNANSGGERQGVFWTDEQWLQMAKISYETIRDFSEGFAAVASDNSWGFINSRYRPVISTIYAEVRDFREGYAAVALHKNNTDWEHSLQWGYIDTNGKMKIRAKYDHAGSFIDGVALVFIKNIGYGFINHKGKAVIPLKYSYAEVFCEGRALVRYGKKFTFITTSGKEITALKYDDAESFNNGRALVKADGKYGYIDIDGNEVIPLEYDYAEKYFSDKLSGADAWVCSGGKWGLIDIYGKALTPMKYDEIRSHRRLGKYYILARLDSKWAVLGNDGKELTAFKYDRISYFGDGVAMAEVNGKWGLIDADGREITPIKYDNKNYNQDFHGGFTLDRMAVSINDKWGFVDRNGREIIPLMYDYVESFHDPKKSIGWSSTNREGLALVNQGNNFFYIDVYGNKK